MGIFLLWATWAHEYTSETASNPEGVVCTTLSKDIPLSRGNQTPLLTHWVPVGLLHLMVCGNSGRS